ncbi:hypothetical protein D9M70_577200 [compost metagenome]
MQSPGGYRRSAKITSTTDQNSRNVGDLFHAIEDLATIAQKTVIRPVMGDEGCESEPCDFIETAIDWCPVGVERNMCRLPSVPVACCLQAILQTVACQASGIGFNDAFAIAP